MCVCVPYTQQGILIGFKSGSQKRLGVLSFKGSIMIKKVNSAKKFDNKKKLSAILKDGQSPRWLSYYLKTGMKLAAVLPFSDLGIFLYDLFLAFICL